MFFVLVNSQNYQAKGVNSPQNAQAQFVGIPITENIHQIYQLVARNDPERDIKDKLKGELKRALGMLCEQKLLFNIPVTGKQKPGAKSVGNISNKDVKRAGGKILRLGNSQVAFA